MAAHSSKGQWRTFLQELIDERGLELTPRQAWTALNDQFGADVSSADRRWCKDTLRQLAERTHTATADAAAKKSAAATKKSATAAKRSRVLLSSESDDEEMACSSRIETLTETLRAKSRI